MNRRGFLERLGGILVLTTLLPPVLRGNYDQREGELIDNPDMEAYSEPCSDVVNEWRHYENVFLKEGKKYRVSFDYHTFGDTPEILMDGATIHIGSGERAGITDVRIKEVEDYLIQNTFRK